MMLICQIPVLLLGIVATAASTNAPQCCADTFLIKTKRCSDGRRAELNCSKYFLYSPDEFEDGIETDSVGNLLLSDDMIPRSEYCTTKADDVDIYLVCLFEERLESNHPTIRAALEFLSIAFLLMTLTVYVLVKDLRDLQGLCTMHALGAMAVSFLGLGVLQVAVKLSQTTCFLMSLTNYFAFMVTFFWLNVISFQIFKSVVLPDITGTDRQWYHVYLGYGYGTPLIFLTALLIAHHVPGDHIKPGFAETRCWFRGDVETWAYFYGPMLVLLCVNSVLFAWTVIRLTKEDKVAGSVKLRSLKYKVALYCKLFLVMGLLWFFEILSMAFTNVHVALDYLWVVTDYINMLQGLIIFLLLVVFRGRALRGLANRNLGCFKLPGTWKSLSVEEDDREDVEAHLSNPPTA